MLGGPQQKDACCGKNQGVCVSQNFKILPKSFPSWREGPGDAGKETPGATIMLPPVRAAVLAGAAPLLGCKEGPAFPSFWSCSGIFARGVELAAASENRL